MLPGEDALKLAATLDAAHDPTLPLPLLWHWAFFNPIVSTAELGPDGHPRRESPLLDKFPTTNVGRRQGSQYRDPARDTPTVRRTRLLSHEQKRGSTGELLIVTLEHTVEQRGNAARRGDPRRHISRTGWRHAAEGPAVEAPTPNGWRETFSPTAQLLFRFSAVTFNSHRIHYDHDYATRVERYPALVVHGPLTAMMLAGAASRHLGRPMPPSPTAPQIRFLSTGRWLSISSLPSTKATRRRA